MMIAFATQPILTFRRGELIRLPDGRYAVRVSSTEVLSVQPDGSYQTRPASAIGAWETATLAGDKLVYTPEDRVYVIPVVDL